MSTHTPGPWGWSSIGALYGSDHGYTHTVDGVSVTCAECGHEAHECGPPVMILADDLDAAEEYAANDEFVVPSEADARLIAAAPDLLEALRKLLDWMPRVSPAEGQEDEWEREVNAACAAIAKATGEET